MPALDNRGKQPAPAITPLGNPSAGSANPSSSLSALWQYLVPALDHIVRSPSNSTDKAPAVDADYHIRIHTAVYNYFTAQSQRADSGVDRGDGSGGVPNETDLYDHLDRFFAGAARDVLLGAPQDESLVRYLVPCFARYAAGARAAHRLLNYVNRYYVKRAVDEDRGWLRLADVIPHVVHGLDEDDSREKISMRLKDYRADELRRWGYSDGDSPEALTAAEASAEAASAADRVVPLSSLAYRRFRTEVVEPLLAVPKAKAKGKAKGKKGKPAAANGERPQGPKGRLARSVKTLLETEGVDAEDRRRLAEGVALCLQSVGVRPDHPLRVRLDKYLATPAPF